MKFYDREEDIESLEGLYRLCKEGYGKISVITGRRWVGKTVLAKKFTENKKSLYLFISKKAEKLMCDEFIGEYESFIGRTHIGEINRVIDLFELLLQQGKNEAYVFIKIFQDAKEPLLGRADKIFYIKPFQARELVLPLSDHRRAELQGAKLNP